MTGIFIYFCKKDKINEQKAIYCEKQANKIAHRGSKFRHSYLSDKLFLKVFTNSAQKENNEIIFHSTENEKNFVLLDGEITNIKEIQKKLGFSSHKTFPINELLFKGFQKWKEDFFKQLRGSFSLVLGNSNNVIVGKDPIGFNPLYYVSTEEELIIGSELKVLSQFTRNPKILPPGTYFNWNIAQSIEKQYYNYKKLKPASRDVIQNLDLIKSKLFVKLDQKIKQIMESNRKVRALLSGGIDSAIICALAQQYKPNLEVYTVYSDNSIDLEHAQNFIQMYPDLTHHMIKIDPKEFLQFLPDVIYALETFDAALIRSALPMYYLCSHLPKDTEILLTGEGADELFGGYSYLKNYSTSVLNDALLDLLKVEHATGLQRVDRIPYSFNIDARAPWFDLELTQLAFKIPTDFKIKETQEKTIEKWIIRETFKKILPKSIYLRDKAKFSKGVGTQFFLRNYFEENISDEEFKENRKIYTEIDLKNKEELHYWRIFNNQFKPSLQFIKNLPRTNVFIQ